MDIYIKKTRWKLLLLLVGAGIVIVSILYSNYIAEKLAYEEQKKVELWAEAMKRLTSSNPNEEDIDFIFKVIENNETIPVIVVDKKGKVVFFRNVDSTIVNNKSKLDKELEEMASSHQPIEIQVTEEIKQYVLFKDSILLQQLRIFPYVQLFLIIVFIALSYYAFSTTRRAEQNRVWVGLSKETAHQLGTPIFSLRGWVDLLKTEPNIDQYVISELEKDVYRLQLIADRFSKVGSLPELKPLNIVEVVSRSVDYMKPRAAKNVDIEINASSDKIIAPANETLFSWVLENLLKNSIDAISSTGKIVINISQNKNKIYIDVVDNGKGIPKNKHKTIFKPGYSTKSRGWGLGLSLAKRIIEEYHRGKIFVKESEPGKGTTIRIVLKSFKDGKL
jgi:signal transduction histidine kinase